MTELWVTIDPRPGGTVVSVRGKILYDTEAPLGHALKTLLAGPAPQIVVDLHEVDLCDSSGLQLLIDTRRQAVVAGGWLRLSRPSPLVARVLEITNLTELMSVYGSVEAAVSGSESPGSEARPGVGQPDGRRPDDG